MGTDKLRITTQTLNVLGALVSSRDEISGADIARLTKLSSGTLPNPDALGASRVD
jgi:hypothetical protein